MYICVGDVGLRACTAGYHKLFARPKLKIFFDFFEQQEIFTPCSATKDLFRKSEKR